MKKTLTRSLILLALSAPVLAPMAQAQNAQTQIAQTQTATAGQSPWTQTTLQSATYVVLAPNLEGTPGTLDASQQKSVLTAMQHDLQGAVLRKYPNAKFVTDAATPGAITLHPVLVVPGSLLPWNSFQARVEMAQNGTSAVIKDNFGVWDVYSHRADAANYLFDTLIAKLP